MKTTFLVITMLLLSGVLYAEDNEIKVFDGKEVIQEEQRLHQEYQDQNNQRQQQEYQQKSLDIQRQTLQENRERKVKKNHNGYWY